MYSFWGVAGFWELSLVCLFGFFVFFLLFWCVCCIVSLTFFVFCYWFYFGCDFGFCFCFEVGSGLFCGCFFMVVFFIGCGFLCVFRGVCWSRFFCMGGGCLVPFGFLFLYFGLCSFFFLFVSSLFVF